MAGRQGTWGREFRGDGGPTEKILLIASQRCWQFAASGTCVREDGCKRFHDLQDRASGALVVAGIVSICARGEPGWGCRRRRLSAGVLRLELWSRSLEGAGSSGGAGGRAGRVGGDSSG